MQTVFIILVFIGAAWYLYQRARNAFKKDRPACADCFLLPHGSGRKTPHEENR